MGAKPGTPFISLSRQMAALIALAVAPIAIAIGEFGGFGRGEFAFLALGCIGMSIRFAWPLRNERWFWILIVLVTIAHGLAITLLDWSWLERWGKSAALLSYPDFFLISGVIYLAYRAIYGTPAKSVDDDPEAAPAYGERDLKL